VLSDAGQRGRRGQTRRRRSRSAEFDLAILDVNLRGEIITMPVAKLITARGCPIIFATGYGTEGVPEEFRDLPGAAEALPAQGPGNLDR
jgi:hypothetical protein